MAKKRRTREQKVKADLRHHHQVKDLESPVSEPRKIETELPIRNTFQFKAEERSVGKNLPKNNPLATEYTYLRHDLRKTGILTASIVVGQIALYFLMNSIT